MASLLKNIFVSRVRIKLLEVLLSKPGELFYVRQLVRATSEEINAVRRELANLQGAGMIIRENRANRVYYYFNKKNVLYEELLSMINKTTGLGKLFLKQRQKLGKIKAVYFSLAFAEKQPYSEEAVDVVIIGDVVLPEISALIGTEQIKLDREINYTVLDIEEYTYRKTKRDPFVLTLLTMPRVMIIGSQFDLFN